MRMEAVPGQSAVTKTPDYAVLEVAGRLINLDESGFLVDPADWSPTVAEAMAEADGLTLTDEHWLLIDFLHRFHAEFGIAPELAILARNLCKDQKDCRWTRRYINELFPGGARSACRYAGLPRPVGRSCG